MPNITLEDTGNMEQILLYLPFTNTILTPIAYHRNHGKKQINYNGFHETAYIHPDYLSNVNISSSGNRKAVLVRLVDWTASHDVGHKGLTPDILHRLIQLNSNILPVRILSEKPLPSELLPFKLLIKPYELHDFLQNVRLYIGEGATLASECALLGIPAIYVNSRSTEVIDVRVNAGLLYHFISGDGVMDKVKQILNDDQVLNQHRQRAAAFLKDKINLPVSSPGSSKTTPKVFI